MKNVLIVGPGFVKYQLTLHVKISRTGLFCMDGYYEVTEEFNLKQLLHLPFSIWIISKYQKKNKQTKQNKNKKIIFDWSERILLKN